MFYFSIRSGHGNKCGRVSILLLATTMSHSKLWLWLFSFNTWDVFCSKIETSNSLYYYKIKKEFLSRSLKKKGSLIIAIHKYDFHCLYTASSSVRLLHSHFQSVEWHTKPHTETISISQLVWCLTETSCRNYRLSQKNGNTTPLSVKNFSMFEWWDIDKFLMYQCSILSSIYATWMQETKNAYEHTLTM